MSRHPILTLSGMYKYDNTIFEGMTLPDELSADYMKTTILDYCGSNEVRYPDPALLKTMIENFFYINTYMIKTLVGSIMQEYSPIENYDRYEDTNRKINGVGTTNTTTEDLPGMVTTTTPGEIDEEKVSAFNSDEYEPSRRMEKSGTNKIETSGSNKTTNAAILGNQSDDSYTAHMHGNIGVTTNQQMLEAERQIAMFSVYKEVAMQFENEITIPVY